MRCSRRRKRKKAARTPSRSPATALPTAMPAMLPVESSGEADCACFGGSALGPCDVLEGGAEGLAFLVEVEDRLVEARGLVLVVDSAPPCLFRFARLTKSFLLFGSGLSLPGPSLAQLPPPHGSWLPPQHPRNDPFGHANHLASGSEQVCSGTLFQILGSKVGVKYLPQPVPNKHGSASQHPMNGFFPELASKLSQT